jgi:hypothetical protein
MGLLKIGEGLTMRLVPAFACLALFAGGSTALAQPGEEAFHEQTLRSLERIERALERLERRLDGPVRPAAEDRDDEEDLVAASNELCGTANGDCQRSALNYCRRLNYQRGAPMRIETRGGFNYMVRVRCFN